MKPIIWVARPDKTGWNATRARDRVDYSFCVYREDSATGNPARLVVRETYTDKPEARARKVIGEFMFDTAKRAKDAVVNSLIMYNDEAHYPPATVTREVLRDKFLRTMQWSSEQDSLFYSTMNWFDSPVSGAGARPVPVVNPAPETVPPATLMDQANNQFAADPGHNMTGIDSIASDVIEAMQMLEQVEQMVEPVFDPENWSPGDAVPAGWAIIGGKPVQFSWPK